MDPDASLECGLLTNVVRSLTSSASDDQRELERDRLEKGFRDSGHTIDKLLVEHEGDVSNCLDTFRKVSNRVTNARERIHNVKNSLHTCKTLLQCRRDDLKKLWMEKMEQQKVNTMLDQIHEIKHLDVAVEQALQQNRYAEAVNLLKKSEILLNGQLSNIPGLNQLRQNVTDSSQTLFNKMVSYLLDSLVVVPFERQMFELVKALSDATINQSELCVRLREKYSPQIGQPAPSPLNEFSDDAFQRTVPELLDALTVFDQLDSAFDIIFNRSSALYVKCVNETVEILLVIHGVDVSDTSQLLQLMQTIVAQVRCAFKRHEALANGLAKSRQNDEVGTKFLARFWTCVQDVVKSVVGAHLALEDTEARPGGVAEARQKSLFRFENTTCVSVHSSSLKAQNISCVCPRDPYNIVTIFHVLNRFCVEIESKPGGVDPKSTLSALSVYLNTVVMDNFIEHVKRDMEKKTEAALTGAEVWSALSTVSTHDARVLTSAAHILGLCDQIAGLIKNMETFTQRFASLWLLILEVYTRNASDTYHKITRTLSTVDGDSYTEHQKISAAWAVDEDISRLLKSLPNWMIISQSTPGAEQTTPTGMMMSLNDSEPEIRKRTERESEILIGNLGTQNPIRIEQLITDMEHVKSLVCMHESLQWFATCMYKLVGGVSDRARKHMKECRIQMRLSDGETTEEVLEEALKQRLNSLEQMAETCLLMLHLELRVHCFHHLLPLARIKGAQDEHDREVVEFGKDMRQFHNLLSSYLTPSKLKYLFDGLGHLCASIFIHSSQHMTKLTENGRKRVCRNIFTVQKYLSQLTGRPETELNRAETFFELLNKDPDQLLALIMERGATFSPLEYTYLLSLSVRSHHSLSSQPGALEAKTAQLREVLTKIGKHHQ